MLGNPGVPGANLPAMLDESHVMRRLADLERAYRELVASTAVRPGSLGNDALTSPVVPGEIFNQVQGFGLTTSPTVIHTMTLTVPAGITSACISLVGSVAAYNSSASADRYVFTIAIGVTNIAPGYSLSTNPVTSIYTAAAGSKVLTFLTPGATITITNTVNSVLANWPASSPPSYSTLMGFVLWFR